MSTQTIHILLNYCIAAIWMINGLYCKVLNRVPRHQKIVGRILGDKHSRLLTIAIGFAEMIMAAWIISQREPKLNVTIQILIIAIMNTLEFILVPDLLLWGRGNAIFAFLLILVIYYNEFYLT